jgi:hypothetical protein
MTPSLRAALLCLPLALGACAGVVPPERATLPRDFISGAGDPTRGAVFAASGTFAQPARLAARPAEAARALALMEYIAVELPQDPFMSRRLEGQTELRLIAARQEWRGTLGVPPTAPAQGVIDGLFAASDALAANDRQAAGAALTPGVFTAGPDATISRLAALPPLPQTTLAAAMAFQSINREIENSRDAAQDFGGQFR